MHQHPRRPAIACALIAGALTLAALGGCAPADTAAAERTTPTAATPTASARPASAPAPRLASADNFRDVAGEHGYPTAGGTMKRGVVYRSNALDLTDADLATLGSLGIAQVYDLRTDSEITQTPDRVPAGARWTQIDLLGAGNLTGAMPTITSAAQATEYLIEANRALVTSPQARAGLKDVLTGIEHARGPVVIHCTAGKDRAGFVSAILQSIAGVSHSDIMADYLLTNERTKDRVAAQLADLADQHGQPAADAYAPLLGVQPQFLQAAFDQITSDYGSLTGYLITGVGLTAEDIAALQATLTA